MWTAAKKTAYNSLNAIRNSAIMGKSVKDIIKEQLGVKGFSLARLYQLTGIPERYLTGILEANTKNLPALPYVRGYLLKIAAALGLNGNDLWREYQREAEIQSSGLKDRLPENRYAIKTRKMRWPILMTAVIVLLGGYLALNAGNIFGHPSLTIYSPKESLTVTASAIQSLAGKINPKDILKINGEEIVVSLNGEFNEFYDLQAGLNTFEITVKRLLGKKTKVVKQVIYENK